MEPAQEKFMSVFAQIQRDGAQDLLQYLQKSDFFTAPASNRRHLSVEGGLCLHSLHVYERLLKNLQNEYGNNVPYSLETIAIVALLHDVCKVNFYTIDYKNQKIDGVWQQVPYYKIEDTLPYGHGEKSVYIVNGFMRLTREEAMAINWHMGAFDDRCKGMGMQTMSEAFSKFPLAFWLHISDMQATYLDEQSE